MIENGTLKNLTPAQRRAVESLLTAGNVAAAAASQQFSTLATVLTNASTGHFITRSYTQIGTAVTAGNISDSVRGATVMGAGNLAYPSPIAGGIPLAPCWLTEVGATLGARGLLPGIWNILHNRPLTDGDTFTVSAGSLAGRSFEIVDLGASVVAQFAIETSDTWGGF